MTKPSSQQYRAIRLYLWNLAPQSLPDPVNNTDSGLKRLAVHVGSIEKVRRWLSQWTLRLHGLQGFMYASVPCCFVAFRTTLWLFLLLVLSPLPLWGLHCRLRR